jgi:DNA-binding CsgD family transcriptional regulator
MLRSMMELAGAVLAAETAVDASTRFYDSMQQLGATYQVTRLYHRPPALLNAQTHWAAGGYVAWFAPEAWPQSEACRYVCLDRNPLVGAIRENRTRFRFSDYAPRDDSTLADYWDAMSEAGIHDALCAASYGAEGAIASVHLGFGERAFTTDQALAVQCAELALTEKLITFAAPPAEPRVRLTNRERDALALVGEGKSDWEISVILGVSEATARFHVDNARKKLGAVSRAHAVARLLVARLI